MSVRRLLVGLLPSLLLPAQATAQLGEIRIGAIGSYVAAVKSREYPAAEHCF